MGSAIFSMAMICIYVFVSFSLVKSKLKEVFFVSEKKRIEKLTTLREEIRGFRKGEAFSRQGNVFDPDNPACVTSLKIAEVITVYISPISEFLLLIPIFIILKGLAIPLLAKLAISGVIIAVLVALPAHSSMKLFNGEASWFGTMMTRSRAAHAVWLSVQLFLYALCALFFGGII